MTREARTVKVWDGLVRVFHWGLGAAFVTAWWSGDDYETLHLIAGYAALGLIALRIAWGIIGTGYARFGQFVRAPTTVLSYLRDIATGREVRYLGHNPAGGAMVVALLALIAAICITGWLLTDLYWGSAMLEQVHEVLTNVVLGLVGLHIMGVLLASFRHRENLVLAMITGRKRAADGDDVA